MQATVSIQDIQLGTQEREFALVDPKDAERTVATIKVRALVPQWQMTAALHGAEVPLSSVNNTSSIRGPSQILPCMRWQAHCAWGRQQHQG